MKKLTLNRLAFSGLRANWKDYVLLWVGVFLTVFFTVGTLLGLDILFQRSEAETAAEYGREDALFFSAEAAPEDLTNAGLAREAGAVTLVGTLRNFPVGCYDNTARSLLSRRCLEGRLPMEAGEAAMDRKVLERLFRDARIGDTLVLPITDGSGQTRQKEYRLVGVLQAQFQGDSELEDYLPQGAMGLPEVLLGSQEDFAPVCRHIVFTFPLGGSLEKCRAAYPEGTFLGIDSAGALYEDHPYYNSFSALREQINMGSSLILAGSALLLGSMLGILSAVSGQFYRKEEQYRMLRTIGATRRQIRAISSREALLLTLLTAPVGSLCAIAFVALLRRIFPESLPCAPRLRWVLAGVAVSCGLVWVAARLPGMVYRPTSNPPRPLLPVRTHRNFRLSALWNQRKVRFHPFRSLCTVVLVSLFCLSAIAFSPYFSASIYSVPDLHTMGYADMELRTDYYSLETGYFTPKRIDRLSPDVLSQLEAMPGVEKASGYWMTDVIALTDHVGSYYPLLNLGNRHLFSYRPELLTEEQKENLETNPSYQRSSRVYQVLQQQLQTDLIPFDLQLVVLDDVTQLDAYLVSGTIDLDAIDQGNAVLVDLPTYYRKQSTNGISGLSMVSGPDTVQTIRNDQIRTGDTLPLVQLCLQENTYDPLFWNGAVGYFPFSQAEKRSADPTVCGVLSCGKYGFRNGTVFTTPQGLQNLGLRCDNTQSITIDLVPDVSSAQKEAVWDFLQRLACREDHLRAEDNTGLNEAFTGTETRHAFFRGSLCVMLFLLTTMQIQGDIRRQLHAETRTIGILRSVGCDEKTLRESYHRQITVSACIGSLLTLVLYLIDLSPSFFPIELQWLNFDAPLFWTLLPVLCVTAATIVVNDFLLRKALHRLVGRSVVENIREE